MKIKIEIGQPAIMGIPMGEPMMTFIVGDKFVQVGLFEVKKWIDEICNSKGNQNKKAYEARDKLQSLFSEIIYSAIKHHDSKGK